MRFDLSYGKSVKCFFEDIQKISTMVFGNYSIVNPNKGHPLHPNHTISVQVLIYTFVSNISLVHIVEIKVVDEKIYYLFYKHIKNNVVY
jgi:hypothetical protein